MTAKLRLSLATYFCCLKTRCFEEQLDTSFVFRVHSPTNALFYFQKYIKIYIKTHTNIAPNVSVFDHHQGACTEPG